MSKLDNVVSGVQPPNLDCLQQQKDSVNTTGKKESWSKTEALLNANRLVLNYSLCNLLNWQASDPWYGACGEWISSQRPIASQLFKSGFMSCTNPINCRKNKRFSNAAATEHDS
jgi:hypothetical protein